MAISVSGYVIAAIGYLVLGCLALIGRRGTLPRLVALAALSTSVWALLAVSGVLRGQEWNTATGIADAVRHGAWFAFMLVILFRRSASPTSQRTLQILSVLSVLFPGIIGVGWLAAPPAGELPLPDAGGGWGIAHLLMSILGLVLLENLYRETPRAALYGVKFFVIGLGGIFVYDAFLYADALLFRAVDVDLLAARGLANALTLPLIAVALMRNPDWDARIHVSRGVAFHSMTLIVSGAFLLVMAAAGYYVRATGGAWGAVLQVGLIFAALLLAAATAASGRFRAAVRLFLNRNFYSYEYDYRREWMKFLGALSDETGGRLEDRVLHAIADVFDVPDGLLWLREQKTYRPAAIWNVRLAASEREPGGPMTAALADGRQMLCGPSDEESALPVLRDPPQWLIEYDRAWLVAPLIHGEDLLGFLVLGRPRVPRRFSLEDRDLLGILSRHAASFLAEAAALRELERTRRFEEFNRRSTFVLHGIKSVSSQLSFLASNAERHLPDPEFQEDLLETLREAVQKMDGLMARLRDDEPAETGVTATPVEALVGEIVRGFKRPPETLLLRSAAGSDTFVSAPKDPLAAGIRNLIQNGLEAAGPAGHVRVELSRRDTLVIIEVADDGPGMSREFVEQELFQPFRSTKTGGFGIGVYECQQVVERAGGRIEVDSECGKGTKMRILLPLLTKPD